MCFSMLIYIFYVITGERETLHRKTFTKWVNAKLAQVRVSYRLLQRNEYCGLPHNTI